MRFLITGDAGFIGRHLAQELRDHGAEVEGFDISRAPGDDVLVSGAFRAAAERTRPDAVIHLAARVGRLFGEAEKRQTVRSNAEMTTVVASVCGELGVRLVYASTSEVYGDQGDAVCREDGPLTLSHNLYGVSKRWGEDACNLYAPDGLTILRFSMPYGPGVPVGRGRAALPNVLWQAHTGQRIPIHRGAERSWCWIGDTVAAARLSIDAGAGIYNIGRDDAACSMYDLAVKACGMVGASPELIDMIDPPERQTVVKRLCTDKIRALGWRPTVELDAGMRLVYDWVRHFDARGRYVGDDSGGVEPDAQRAGSLAA